MGVTAIVGTVKGAVILRSDEQRADWRIEGPIFKGWKVTASARLPGGEYLAATASDVYGAALQKSGDLSDWKQIAEGPAYEKGSEVPLTQIWTIEPAGDAIYCGVADAGIFRSTDEGESWQALDGLNKHPTREAWFPGNGGLCLHSIRVDPTNPERIWAGISAVGVFRSDDGGETWQTKNEGMPVVIEDESRKDIGFCVHGLELDPEDPNRLYRREHVGMFLSTDGGDTWERNEEGLPFWFGFPIALHRPTGTLFTIPLESDEYRIPADGALKVYRSTDRGESWEPLTEGLPQEHAWIGVLRGAMAVDDGDPAGILFGTTSGEVYVSNDGGESFRVLPLRLPRILTIEVYPD